MEPLTLQFPTVVDSTIMATYGSCPRKAMIEFCLQRAPQGRSVHLHAGGCFAHAMETIRRKIFAEGMETQAAIDDTFWDFMTKWGDYDPPANEYKDFVNVWGAVEAYMKEFPPRQDYFQPWMLNDGQPAVELRLSIPTRVKHPVTGEPIIYGGRIDALMTNDGTTCYALDDKTTKALGDSWYKQWDMRGQFYGYAYMARAFGFPCVGALVRGTAIQQTKYAFAEVPLMFENWQLDAWWENVQRRIQRFAFNYELAMDLDEKDMLDAFELSYGDACASYGTCQFLPICTRPDPLDAIGRLETRIWKPMEQDPTASSPTLPRFAEQTLSEFLGVALE